MSTQSRIDFATIAARHAQRRLPLDEFYAAQRALMATGHPDDPCGRPGCGCKRRYHLPKPTFPYAKSGGSSGRSVEVECVAPTCCDGCPYCFDDCVAFVEPEYGSEAVRRGGCMYDPEHASQWADHHIKHGLWR